MFKKKYGKAKKHCFAKCFVVAALCLCCTACSAGSPAGENQAGDIAQTTVLTTSTTARPTEPPTITLTKENIEEYLIFNAKTGDVEMTEYPGFELGKTYVTVTTSSKKELYSTM